MKRGRRHETEAPTFETWRRRRAVAATDYTLLCPVERDVDLPWNATADASAGPGRHWYKGVGW